MSELKNFVGRRSETWKFQVTEERLRQFCDAVGAPYRGEAPLTFLTLFRDGEFKLLADFGFQLSQVLHADQEFNYLDKIVPGDHLEYQTTFSKALEKRGSTGVMRFLVFDTEVRAQRGSDWSEVGNLKTTIIVRESA